MKTVLVTGATGFLGQHLLDVLRAAASDKATGLETGASQPPRFRSPNSIRVLVRRPEPALVASGVEVITCACAFV